MIDDAPEADIWVMDPAVKTIEVPYPLRDTVLQRVRGVEGVAWAVPFFKASTRVRTRRGTLDNAIMIGVDDVSLVGVPDRFLLGTLDDLTLPDAIAINPAGFRLLFPGEEPDVGRELELNDRRARIVAIVDASPAFSANLTIYTRYSLATRYTNNGRNTLCFVLAKAADPSTTAVVADRIAAEIGLKAVERATFRRETIRYILETTGIPASFGTVVLLGVLIGIAIVGLTFNQFVMENIRQYAALKAIGVRNGWLLAMTLTQAAFIATIGYGIGLAAAAGFFATAGQSDALRGFRLLPEVAIGVALLAGVIVLLATTVSLRRVFFVDPATVFRG